MITEMTEINPVDTPRGASPTTTSPPQATPHHHPPHPNQASFASTNTNPTTSQALFPSSPAHQSFRALFPSSPPNPVSKHQPSPYHPAT